MERESQRSASLLCLQGSFLRCRDCCEKHFRVLDKALSPGKIGSCEPVTNKITRAMQAVADVTDNWAELGMK